MCWCFSISNFCRIYCISFVIFPCYRVFIYFICICCCVCSIFCNHFYLRSPTCKGICILRCCCFAWFCMRWHSSIFHLCRINCVSIIIFPRNGVFIYSICICCCISCFPCYCSDFWAPTIKSVCILCCCFFAWITMSWHFSISHFCRINCVSIVIFPRNGIFIYFTCISCSICCISCYSCYFWAPSSKCICILCCCFFAWITMSWHFSIGYFCRIYCISIVIFPCNGVFIYSTCVCCLICCISCNTCYFWAPTIKSVCILCCCFFAWITMSWHFSISHFCRINCVSIVIFPRNGIFIYFTCISCSICCISCYSCYFWAPSSKCICILCCCFFAWITMSWHFSISYCCRIYCVSFVIFPCNGVFIYSTCICRSISCFSCYRTYAWTPS